MIEDVAYEEKRDVHDPLSFPVGDVA